VDINSNSPARAARFVVIGSLKPFIFALTLGLVALLGFPPPAQALDGDELAKTLFGQFAHTDHTRRLPQVYLAVGLQELVGGEVGIVSSTGSMVPALNYNDVAIVLPVKISQVKVGDIVVYHGFDAEGTALHVIHRVIAFEMGGTALRVKGDANPGADAILVTDQNIIGRVRFVVRSDTCQIRDYANSPAGELTTYRQLAALTDVADKSPSTVYAEP
jgi:signal peptidase I